MFGPSERAATQVSEPTLAGDNNMKTLYLLRHAKSSWDSPQLKDFERPLKKRGLHDIPVMAQRFRERGSEVDIVVTSPAERAKSTAKRFAEAIELPQERVASNPDLYFAGVGMLLKAASLFDEDYSAGMLVGHNPAITEFANAMANTSIDNVPTCGLVQMELPISAWSEIQPGSAKIVEFDYPKKLED